MANAADLAIEGLTVERRTDPIGIDALHPRFAWRLVGAGSSARQTAYQLQVVNTDDPSASWSTPTWDSGRGESAASTYVAYAGPPLVSRHCHSWRVRVWNADGLESAWSRPAAFEMGLLSAADWSARWIAHVVPDLVSEPEEMRRQQPAPALRRRFGLSSVPRRARLYITALGLYEAYINGTRVGDERLAPGWTDYNRRIQYGRTTSRRCCVRGVKTCWQSQAQRQFGTRAVLARKGRHRYGDAPGVAVPVGIPSIPLASLLTVATDATAGWLAAVAPGSTI